MKILWIIGLVFFAQVGMAQISTGFIKGKVVDQSGEPLAYANLVFTQNGKLVKGVSTDIHGSFKAILGVGKYQLSTSYIGFTTKVTDLSIEPRGQVLHLALEQGYLLKEIVVTGYDRSYDKDILCYGAGFDFGSEKKDTKKQGAPKQKTAIKTQKIYPNPTFGAFTIHSSAEITQVVVMNLLGRVVLSQNEPGTRQTLNISHLPAGVYIVNYRHSGGWVSEKLILTK